MGGDSHGQQQVVVQNPEQGQQHQQQQQQQQQQHQQIYQQQQHYQHQPLSNVFPSIYESSGNYGQLNMSSNNSASLNGANNGVSNVQRQIQQDWTNREEIETITSNIKKITDFLNSFELSCRSKLAMLDEKLSKLEKQIDFVEAKVTKGETLN